MLLNMTYADLNLNSKNVAKAQCNLARRKYHCHHLHVAAVFVPH